MEEAQDQPLLTAESYVLIEASAAARIHAEQQLLGLLHRDGHKLPKWEREQTQLALTRLNLDESIKAFFLMP